MASTGLTKTFTSSPTDNKKGTMSFWMKRSGTGATQQIGITVAGQAGGNAGLQFNSSDQLYMYLAYTGTWQGEFLTNRVFRDTSAWYHIVVTWDTTQSTSTNRMKLYVNGVQETSLSTENYPAQDTVTTFGNATAHYINYWNNGTYFDGVMSHFHFTDGYSYDASAFGQADANGVWTINTSPSVTYGTNGFFILKDGNSVTDQSGNSNNWTVATGTLTNTEDNPSNVFDSINYNLSKTASVAGRDATVRIFIDNGNTRLSTDVPAWTVMLGSMAMSSGKYYFEALRKYEGSPSNHLAWIGIEEISTAGTNLGSPTGRNNHAIGFYSDDGNSYKSNSSTGNNYGTWTSNNDIAMCAIDLDNNYIYFGVNGTWGNSSDPTSGATGTGATAITSGKTYITSFTTHRGGGSAGGDKSWLSLNFGNGYFQNTAVSSPGTNTSGHGIFEYDVPTGYTAICTKGLNGE